MKIGETIHGFKVWKKTEIPEVSGTFYEAEHVKTGAKLGWMKTEDINKTFCIGFKTVPEDSTGVFHILEHSVLQGSEKYPVKAPFVELIKSSMNTFLNAMTFPDKTLYPVCSRNSKDFENLMRVYLDAVFHPCLHQNEKIFLQEGWHYEAENEGEMPFYNGIVLNEMRGASSSVDACLINEMNAALFPDNCYKYVSGGDPEEIVTLTYERFAMTHKRFYHPSNAYIILDGAVDIERTLSVIDEDYLSEFWREERSFEIPVQKQTGMRRIESEYAVEALDANQGFLGLGYVVGMYFEQNKIYAAKILADYLAGSNESPLKKALFAEGLALDISTQLEDHMMQPVLLLQIRNIECKNRTRIEELVIRTITEIRREGIPKEELEALLFRLEFQNRERDFGGYPTGLMNALSIMESWHYGGEPTASLSVNGCFEKLHEEIRDGSFIRYLDEIFLLNEHRASICMKPSDTYVQQAKCREDERLSEFYDSCSDEEKTALWEKQADLKSWQAVPNTEQDCRVLPGLALDDISREPVSVPTQILSDGTIFHQTNCNGIKYVRLFFPLQGLTDDGYSCISFLAGMIGELALKDMDRKTLETEKRSTFGRLSGAVEVYQKNGDIAKAESYLCVEASYLNSMEEKALLLLQRILNDTDYLQKEAVGEFLRQQSMMIEQWLIMNGHQFAMANAKAAVTEEGRISNLVDGVDYCEWMKAQAKAFEEEPDAFVAKLAFLAKQVIVADGVTVSCTYDVQEECTEKMRRILPKREPQEREQKAAAQTAHVKKAGNEGITIPSPIAYAAKVGSLYQKNIRNTGSFLVLAKIATMDFLWNKIRVLGGAYGTGLGISNDGTVQYYSYRDPNPAGSLEIYDKTGEFIRTFCSQENDLTRLIIGSIADTEPVFTARSLGKTGDDWYFSGITDEVRRERRRQMLETTNETLVKLADLLDSLVPEMNSAVVANVEALEGCGEKLTVIKTI